MNDHKELCASLREEAEAVQAIEWEIPICTDNHIREAADMIEKLVAENVALEAMLDFLKGSDAERIKRLKANVARLEAENRAKEQYIAEHMGGTAERNARMRRDAERLRGTGKNK